MAWLVKNIADLSKYPLRQTRRIIHNAVKDDKLTSEFQTDDHPVEIGENPFQKERKVCILCKLQIEPDWKNTRLLSQFQSSYTGRIYGRHITGLCKSKQEKVEREILKAQNCGFMSVYHKQPKYLRDPKLFDPDHPFRHHKY